MPLYAPPYLLPKKAGYYRQILTFISSLFFGFGCRSFSQTIPLANDFASYLPYSGKYSYGLNPGWYSLKWHANQVADLGAGNATHNVKGVGAKSFRMQVYDDFVSFYGLSLLIDNFEHFRQIGAGEITAYVGTPARIHRLELTFPGATEQSKLFKGMYEPVWLDSARTVINPANTYAKYLYDVVKTYGSYVKFWEIVNEPDFSYSDAAWMSDTDPSYPTNWWYRDPRPGELVNLQSPIQYYIHMLRISWDVIKRLHPHSYVSIGGLGYKAFLDAILRNTDNPDGGRVTAQYPYRGGAYFDIVSFHSYPGLLLKEWSNANGGGFVYHRHSDAAFKAHMKIKDGMDSILKKWGYNGVTYPKKQFICTETGMSRIMDGASLGGREVQKNYIIKTEVLTQKDGIVKQMYWFQTGDGSGAQSYWDLYGCYGWFGNSYPYNAWVTDQGIGLKTTSDALYGCVYDATKTRSLELPAHIEGAAFKDPNNGYVYVLWAKTYKDLSELSNASYSFPAGIIHGSLKRKEWDFSQTGYSVTVSSSNLALSGSPSFFEEATRTEPPTTGAYTPIPSKIQAENWSGMKDVRTETCWDEPNCINVGWIDPGDYLDYNVDATVAGTYTVALRVATRMNAARLQIRKQYATGSTLLSELNLPNTGAYQKWQTVYTTVNLQKGPQVVRVLSSSPTGDVWNINWLQFSIAAPVLTSTVEKTALTEEDSIITKGELSALIKPNPVHEQFTLSVQTDFTGPVRIELVDLNGRVKKQYLINKEKAGWLQTTLPAGDLTEGVYIMRLRIQNYHATAKLIKL